MGRPSSKGTGMNDLRAVRERWTAPLEPSVASNTSFGNVLILADL